MRNFCSGFHDQNDFTREVVSGLTLFAAMLYAVLVIPTILEQGGFPRGQTTIAFLFVAGIGSILSGLFLRRPIALAAGVATAVAARDAAIYTALDWDNILVCTAIAGIVVLLISVSGVRLWLLRNLPESVMNAIRAGIGALLVNAALSELVDSGSDHNKFANDALGIFLPSLAVVAICYAIVPRYIMPRSSGSEPETVSIKIPFLQHSAFLWGIGTGLVVALFLAPINFFQSIDMAISKNNLQQIDDFVGEYLAIFVASVIDTFSRENISNAIILVVAFFFIMVSDIAGSPYDYVRSEKSATSEEVISTEEKYIQRGFIIDSMTTSVGGLFGISPQVFYAENHAAWKSGGRTHLPAIIVGIGFIILLVSSLIWQHVITVPRIVVAAPLFFVGLIVISDSLTVNFDEVRARVTQISAMDESVRNQLFGGERIYWIPAAVMISMTPVMNFEYTILFGILTYLVFVHPVELRIGNVTVNTKIALSLWVIIGCIPAIMFFVASR